MWRRISPDHCNTARYDHRIALFGARILNAHTDRREKRIGEIGKYIGNHMGVPRRQTARHHIWAIIQFADRPIYPLDHIIADARALVDHARNRHHGNARTLCDIRYCSQIIISPISRMRVYTAAFYIEQVPS